MEASEDLGTSDANVASKLPNPLSLKILGRYKSISNLTWQNIPGLAVLTGLNGSGKSQLLEFFAYKLTDTEKPRDISMRGVDYEILGDPLDASSVAYLPNDWELVNLGSLRFSEMEQAKSQLFDRLRSQNTINSQELARQRRRLEMTLNVPNLQNLDVATFASQLPNDFSFMLDDVHVTRGLAHLFMAYRFRWFEQIEKHRDPSLADANLGATPWDQLNTSFAAARFPYRVVAPTGSSLLEPYQLQLEDPLTRQQLAPSDLSSGEKMLFALVVWLFNSKHYSRVPRLFLMDEPDAHLHPSMTRHFLNVLKSVLLDQYGVRTILTTHSPTTVALAPVGSVFEMTRGDTEIRPVSSISETIGRLTAGFISVTPATRIVLTEDENDLAFYNALYAILTNYGPSRDPRAIKSSPSLVFKPATAGKGSAKTSGGESVVRKWVGRLNEGPLLEMIKGVRDRDDSNKSDKRIAVLGRYSYENYLADPLVVFALLQQEGKAPVVPDVELTAGDEHLMRTFNTAQLTAIMDCIVPKVEPHLQSLTPADQVRETVTFTNGRSIQYPAWMLNRRGHDLLVAYQAAFGGVKIINPPRLLNTFERVRLIPTELAELLQTLQQ